MDYSSLPTFDPQCHDLLVVIETPKGCRNKYSYNPSLGAFELKKVMPRGMLFPYNFGFIPSTRAGDGDPLDILVLLEDPAPTGCLVRARAIGAIEAEQREKHGEWTRNDRLIAVATHAKLHGNAQHLKDVNPQAVQEICAFFEQYNRVEGREFKVLDECGPKAATRLIDEARRKYSSETS